MLVFEEGSVAVCMLGGIEGSVGGVEGSLALDRLGEFEGWVEFDKLVGGQCQCQ